MPQATVSNVQTGTDTIDFDVDRTGTPILVKTSYFPSWRADGADGPYRVTPNLMVVVPTSNHVHLHFDQTSIDYLANGLTLLGVVLVIVLARMRPLRMPEPPASTEDRLGRFLSGPDLDDQHNVDGVGRPDDVAPSATLFLDREPPPDDP